MSRSMAARFPHGALKLQPRDGKNINRWSVKIVSGSKNKFCSVIIVREPSMEDVFSYLISSWLEETVDRLKYNEVHISERCYSNVDKWQFRGKTLEAYALWPWIANLNNSAKKTERLRDLEPKNRFIWSFYCLFFLSIINKIRDQCQYLDNCASTPPLTQQVYNKLKT